MYTALISEKWKKKNIKSKMAPFGTKKHILRAKHFFTSALGNFVFWIIELFNFSSHFLYLKIGVLVFLQVFELNNKMQWGPIMRPAAKINKKTTPLSVT